MFKYLAIAALVLGVQSWEAPQNCVHDVRRIHEEPVEEPTYEDDSTSGSDDKDFGKRLRRGRGHSRNRRGGRKGHQNDESNDDADSNGKRCRGRKCRGGDCQDGESNADEKQNNGRRRRHGRGNRKCREEPAYGQ